VVVADRSGLGDRGVWVERFPTRHAMLLAVRGRRSPTLVVWFLGTSWLCGSSPANNSQAGLR
jgi:hypothetical protein